MESREILDLITETKSGSEIALKELIHKYKNMGGMFNKVYLEEEEKFQLVQIAIFDAVRSFKPSKKVKFSTHLYNYLRWYILEQDSVNRTGKKVNPYIYGVTPKFEKILKGDRIYKIHNVLFNKGIIKEKYSSDCKTLKILKSILEDIKFYLKHKEIFDKIEQSVPVALAIKYYYKHKAWEPKNCSKSMKNRIKRMNFYLLNSIAHFYIDNEFILDFENLEDIHTQTIYGGELINSDIIRQDGVKQVVIDPQISYSVFYEENLFCSLNEKEQFIINYLYNFSFGEVELWKELNNFVRIEFETFQEKIKTHNNYKALARLLGCKLMDIKDIEKDALKKIKKNLYIENLHYVS